MVDLIEKNLVFRIVGCAMNVHRGVGHGLREKTYERALCLEFQHEKIAFNQQSSYPVIYRDQKIDDYIPDLEVERRVLVDAKTVETITDVERGQMMNYLRITGIKVGLLLNFKHPSLKWERVVLDSAR